MSLKAIEADENLPICATCGAQFDKAQDICFICADDRQWVPHGGSIWTSIKTLKDSGRKIEFKKEEGRDDMIWLVTTPGIAIMQSPLLVKTPSGWAMIECCPFVTEDAIKSINELVAESGLPFLGIALSHPHWYNSGTTWARALGTKIYASVLDKEWWPRPSSVDEVVEWWSGSTLKLGKHVTMVLCGGHFPGSCVTHVQREGGSLLATADTIMIGLSSHRRSVSFMYSYPNFIPLAPPAVQEIWNAVRPYEFADAVGAWPDKRLIGGAKDTILDGVKKFIMAEGWTLEQVGFSE
ncbi:hypothetical protein T439DRAFT_325270 [Meredithblackwellia eburnea MCA 4105]